MISTGKSLTEADGKIRQFITLVMLAAADAYGVYLGEMIGSTKVRPAVVARHAACAVLRRHVAERHAGNNVTFEIVVRMEMEHYPISYPNIGFLFCRDHTAFIHSPNNFPSADRLDAISAAVMSAWQAVEKMGLLPGLMLGKSHATATAGRFEALAPAPAKLLESEARE